MSIDTPKTIDLNYIKSSQFREIACDGVVGGLTPHNKIWVAFYSERFPIPRIVRQPLVETEVPGQFKLDASKAPEHLDGRVGTIRNVEFGAYLSIELAIELRDWLDKQIKMTEGAS